MDRLFTLSLHDLSLAVIVQAAVILICLICIGFLFKALGRLLLEVERANHAVLRLERDIMKHRYAIAKGLSDNHAMDAGEEKSDRQIINDVLHDAEVMIEQAPAPSGPPTSLTGLNDNEILDFLKKALQSDGIALFQQPLVSLPGRKTRYYEVFSRILVGAEGYIPANKFIAVAKNNNLVDTIDNILLMQCLKILKQSAGMERQTEFFINVTSQTFGSKNYITNLLTFLAGNPQLSSRLIFEMTQQDSLNIGPVARSVMERLSLLGCRFSMDQVKIMGMDLDRLLDLNISFVKLDMNSLQKDLANASERKRIKRIKQSLDNQGITVIIEKVENEKQLFNVLDMHFDIGQGYLFGKPELVV